MSVVPADEWPANKIQTDVAILGAGPAGLTLAAGLDTDCIVIESGGHGLDVQNHHLFHSVNSGDATNVDSLRVRGIGGATLRWTGRCIELAPYDFEQREWISATGWPIDLAELRPWYAKASLMLGLSTPDKSAEAVTERGFQATSRQGNFEPCSWQFADHGPGGMVRFGDLVWPAFSDERKVLLHSAHCTELLADNRQVRALRVIDKGGRSLLIMANRFVIATGCVETSRFLLNSSRVNPALLAPVKPWLGKGFSQHLRLDAGVIEAEPKQFRRLQTTLNILRRPAGGSQEFGLTLTPQFARAKRLGNASLILRYNPGHKYSAFNLMPRVWARSLGRTPIFRRGTAQVEIDTEQAVRKSSYIALSDNKDMHGQPRAQVNWTIDSVDTLTGYETMRAFADFIRTNSLGNMTMPSGITSKAIDPDCRRDSNHQLGGTRMSNTNADGVVDANLKVHGTQNLWVVGGSVFSTGGHANPTLTIVALAKRLAAHLGSGLID